MESHFGLSSLGIESWWR